MTCVAGYEDTFFDRVFRGDSLADGIGCPPLYFLELQFIRIKNLKLEAVR